ncbi:MAG TPA: hypothetical protein PLG47_03270 [Candidatus Dojkabacteria bacterium]|nr:hypothetical protein [Candidatus Dojkabacteria bacterium]
MNARFIESCHIPLAYERKEGTKTSYYLTMGKPEVLPTRISFGSYAQQKSSKNDETKKSEINGQYRKEEKGLYFNLNNRKIHSSIWGNAEYPEFYGYGIIDERFGIYDLLIFYSENECNQSFEIHIFKGMGKPELMKQAFQYLSAIKTKKPTFA